MTTTTFMLVLMVPIIVLAQPFQKTNELLTMPNIHPVRESELRQFIGSSVIGGLMWPVLLTLALTAIMARVPDFFQSLFTLGASGTSGGGREFIYDPRLSLLAGPERSAFWEQKLEETLKIFLRATDSYEEDRL